MRWRDAGSLGLGVAALAVAIFALGGATRWAQAAVAILIAAALIPQLLSRRALDRTSPLLALLGVAGGLTVLQVIPLPEAVLEFLQPIGQALRADGVELVGGSVWPSLSLDPPATLRAICYFATLLGAAVLALRIAVSERGRYRLLAMIAIACGVVALVVGIHELFGITDLYGIYELEQARPSVIGPLLNENHLGCLLALGCTIALGLAMHRRQSSALRVVWLSTAAACGAACAATQSRGALLALLAGGVVTIGARLAQRLTGEHASSRARASFVTTSLPLAIVAGSTILLVVYASGSGVADQLSRTTFHEIDLPKSKFAAWHSASHLVAESPWLGIGRGALEPVFTRVHPASAMATFTHVENEYVQAVVDWGIAGALLIGAAALWLAAVMIRRWRDGPLAAGALGAITVVAVQSNVDFGVEMLGIAIPITIVAATLAYVPLREAAPSALRRWRGVRIAHIALLVGVAGLMFAPTSRSLAEEHTRLRAGALPTQAELRGAIERHPLDYYAFAVLARVRLRSGDATGILVLNHALALHPTHSGLHLFAADLLFRAGHVEQASLEYSIALRSSVSSKREIAEIVSKFSPVLAAEAIPTDARLDDTVNTLTDLKRRDVAVLWLERVLRRTSSLRGCELLYQLALAMFDPQIIKSANERCKGFEPSRDVRLQLAQFLVRTGSHDEAIRTLHDVELWQGRIDEKVTAWLLVCDAHTALGRWDAARRCIRQLEMAGYVAPETTRRLEQIRDSQKSHPVNE